MTMSLALVVLDDKTVVLVPVLDLESQVLDLDSGLKDLVRNVKTVQEQEFGVFGNSLQPNI